MTRDLMLYLDNPTPQPKRGKASWRWIPPLILAMALLWLTAGSAMAEALSDTPTAAMMRTVNADYLTGRNHVTADNNPDAKPAIKGATVGDTLVSGMQYLETNEQDVAITLTGDKFKALTKDTDVSAWFANLPGGSPAMTGDLSARIKDTVAQDAATATVTISGAPKAASTDAMSITIPSEALAGGEAITVTSNPDAKWNILKPNYMLYYNADDNKMYNKTTSDKKEVINLPGWTGNGSTLTLNGFSFETTAASGLSFSGDTIVLAAGSENLITSGISGLLSPATLTVQGSGTLTVNVGYGSASVSTGIFAKSGLTIKESRININNNLFARIEYAYGIHVSSGSLTIKDKARVTVTSASQSSVSGNADGISAEDVVTITDSTVNVTANNAAWHSRGIFSSTVTIKNSDVTATAGTGEEGFSYGIYATDRIDIDLDSTASSKVVSAKGNTSAFLIPATFSSRVAAKGSEGTNVEPNTDYDPAKNTLYRWVKAKFSSPPPTPPTVAAPVITPKGGSFINPWTVTISCATPGATVYYTMDGSEPTSSSLAYEKPFAVAQSCTVKARAMRPGWYQSAVVSETYVLIEPEKPYVLHSNGVKEEFETMQEALDAALPGESVIVPGDVEWTGDLIVPAGVTLMLNGRVYTDPANEGKLIVRKDATLTTQAGERIDVSPSADSRAKGEATARFTGIEVYGLLKIGGRLTLTDVKVAGDGRVDIVDAGEVTLDGKAALGVVKLSEGRTIALGADFQATKKAATVFLGDGYAPGRGVLTLQGEGQGKYVKFFKLGDAPEGGWSIDKSGALGCEVDPAHNHLLLNSAAMGKGKKVSAANLLPLPFKGGVTWQSDDESVLKITGKGAKASIRPVGLGSARLTATFADGTSETVLVSVVAKKEAATALTLRKKLKTRVGVKEALDAAVKPATAADKTLLWFTTNAAVADVDQTGVVTALSPGVCKIYALTTAGARKVVTVNVKE